MLRGGVFGNATYRYLGYWRDPHYRQLVLVVAHKRGKNVCNSPPSHALQLLVDGPNVLEVLDELHHHGAIRQGEQLRVLKAQRQAHARAKKLTHHNVHIQSSRGNASIMDPDRLMKSAQSRKRFRPGSLCAVVSEHVTMF